MNPLAAGLCAALMLPLAALAAPAKTATGTWKIDGAVQDTPVVMTCVLTETDHKLTGKCSGAGGDDAGRAVTGESSEKGLGFQFDTVYEGNPITVAMRGSLDPVGDTISGVISVDPMGVDGTFKATRLPDSPAAPVAPAAQPDSAAPAAPPAPPPGN